MKFNATLVGMLCGVVFCGCAPKLPLGSAIRDIQPGESFMSRLTSIAEKVAPTTAQEKTIREVQEDFEAWFFPQNKSDEFELEQVGLRSHKWLNSYAYHSANPEQNLERFDEFVHSAILVQRLMERSDVKPIPANDEGTWRDRSGADVYRPQNGRNEREERCAWLDETGCALHMHKLYNVISTPPKLYKRLREASKNLAEDDDRSSRIMVLGYEIPWDEAKGIRYGVTFYFKDTSWEQDVSTRQSVRSTFLGYEIIYTNETTPHPRVRGISRTSGLQSRNVSLGTKRCGEQRGIPSRS